MPFLTLAFVLIAMACGVTALRRLLGGFLPDSGIARFFDRQDDYLDSLIEHCLEKETSDRD